MVMDAHLIVKALFLVGSACLMETHMTNASPNVEMDLLLETRLVMREMFKMAVIQIALEFSLDGLAKEAILPLQLSANLFAETG